LKQFPSPASFQPVKKKIMKRIIPLFLLFAVSFSATAQHEPADTDSNILRAALKGWHIKLSAGFNVGGTSPLPLPREIRSIEGYSPLLNISVEGAVQKRFDDSRWGMMLGLRFDQKGMETDAKVKNYHIEMTADDGGFMEGAWTGNVKTKVRNTYLTIPVLATYSLGSRWQLSAGPYFSYRIEGEFSGEACDGYLRHHDPTGEKAYVTHASYDFSDDLRRFQWGLQAGGEFKAYKHLLVNANLQWGLNGIFPADFQAVTFDLYPIYANIGFSYLF